MTAARTMLAVQLLLLGALSPDALLPPGQITGIGLPFTPFGADGRLNVSTIVDQHRYALQLGHEAVLIAGLARRASGPF